MTAIANIATRMLTENNYTIDDIPALTVEYLLKNVTDYINLEAGTSISFTPLAGAETFTASDNEIIVSKMGTVLMMRAYLDRGPNASVASVNITAVISDPQFKVFTMMFHKAIKTLTGTGFERA